MECDFRIKVFFTAATQLNFTKTASELFISQPAVSKNIQELEQQIGQSLFERSGNKLKLTAAGSILYKHARLIIEQYNKATYEIDKLKGETSGKLKLGASTTISHYIIPLILANFHRNYDGIHIEVAHGNTQQVEDWLDKKNIDLGIIEGLTQNKSMKYTPLFKDEIVLVTRAENPLALHDTLAFRDLSRLDFIMRENGSGTNDVIAKHLKEKGVDLQDLQINVNLASTESIKQFLLHSNSFAFLSIHAITRELHEKHLKIIEIEDFTIERNFFFIHPHGPLSGLPELFMRFAKQQEQFFIHAT
ncbi:MULTISPECIES: LysR substrate-binding domain-containing protein [Olivibacter]|uniref:LysR substrate-binding domain-containing protein n=1 Tax=Olivibacter jilunii TaxID=985016 RepID=A0ABW6AZA5_9SPHI|nr:LysR family transcriptional regulator [Olivibacter sp. UJ_SKK_5.1]MDX3911925.1 LysR family transcriptional regulator [Pseudosphingobacterium sp.]